MKYTAIISFIFFIGTMSVNAQQQKSTQGNQNAGVQEIVRIVPQLLPQALRDSINNHDVDKKAEITSSEQMSKDGNLIYRVNFLKDKKTWSKLYDANGRHIDESKEEYLFIRL